MWLHTGLVGTRYECDYTLDLWGQMNVITHWTCGDAIWMWLHTRLVGTNECDYTLDLWGRDMNVNTHWTCGDKWMWLHTGLVGTNEYDYAPHRRAIFPSQFFLDKFYLFVCTTKNWQVFLDKEPGSKAGFWTRKTIRVYSQPGKIVCRTHEKINLSRNLSRKNCSSVRGFRLVERHKYVLHVRWNLNTQGSRKIDKNSYIRVHRPWKQLILISKGISNTEHEHMNICLRPIIDLSQPLTQKFTVGFKTLIVRS